MHGLDMTGPGSSERAAARGEASGSSAFSGYSVVPVLAIVGVALLGEVCRPVTVLLVAGAAVLVTCVSLAFLLWAERNVTLFVSAVALVATAGVGAFALQFTEVQAAVNGIARPEPTRVAGPLDRPDATLAQRELRGQVLKGANLAGSTLVHIDLPGAHFEGADLTEARLQGANLPDVHAQGARFVGSDLRGADLRRAVLTGADLSGADLRDVCLRDVVLLGSRLVDAKTDGSDWSGATLPPEAEPLRPKGRSDACD